MTLKKIPELLKPIEKIGFEQLKAKLDTVGETCTQLSMNWSKVIGTLIILAMVILVVQALMRRRKLKLKNTAMASALLSETGEPIGVLFKKNREKVESELSVECVTTTNPPITAEKKGCDKIR